MTEPDPSVHMVPVLQMQLNDAHELTRKAQRKARYLQGELDKEIARRRQLETEAQELHARIAELTKVPEKPGL
jgi:predicted  nucleic acid-binding Zn-ribbon protein